MKVRLLAVTDIRGTIALKEDDRIDWGSLEDKRLFKEITSVSGVIVMGRKTYESIGRNLPGRINVVMSSRTSLSCGSPDFILNESAKGVVDFLEKRGYSDICIIGGQSVFSQFLDAGLVTDIHLTIEPLILPSSFNLFERTDKLYKLKLENVRLLNDAGSIHIHYVAKVSGSKISGLKI